MLFYGFEESGVLIGRPAVRKNPYSDRGTKISVFGSGFFPVFLIALFTACNILICLKTLCVKNKVSSCSTFLYSSRHHSHTKRHTISKNDCEPYNKQSDKLSDISRYRPDVRSIILYYFDRY